jgi:hypothetical protein
MARFAARAVIALLGLLFFAGQAVAAQDTYPAMGEVRALAFAGDAVLVAHQPLTGLVVDSLAPGAPPQNVLRTRMRGDDDQVALAASGQAVAIALNAEPGDGVAPGRVLIGPLLGPLREVGVCEAGLNASPVAVFGSRIAWREGGCGVPVTGPRGTTPSTIVVAGADPGTPVRQLPVDDRGLPVRLVLTGGDSGLLGLLQPSFFLIDSEVRAFSPAGFGAVVAAEQGAIVFPAGILGDGSSVVVAQKVEEEQSSCDSAQVFTIAPGSSERRAVALGGCALGESTSGPITATGPVVSAGRIVALVADAAARARGSQEQISVVSVDSAGGDRRVLARGRMRHPLGIAADGDRVAWWQPGCQGGSEVVVQDGLDAPTTKVAACTVTILTRSARVRGGKVAVRLRCPVGCTGRIYAGRRALRRLSFSLDPGTHVVRVPATLRRGHRSARLRLELSVENGPARAATITIRR